MTTMWLSESIYYYDNFEIIQTKFILVLNVYFISLLCQQFL